MLEAATTDNNDVYHPLRITKNQRGPCKSMDEDTQDSCSVSHLQWNDKDGGIEVESHTTAKTISLENPILPLVCQAEIQVITGGAWLCPRAVRTTDNLLGAMGGGCFNLGCSNLMPC